MAQVKRPSIILKALRITLDLAGGLAFFWLVVLMLGVFQKVKELLVENGFDLAGEE